MINKVIKLIFTILIISFSNHSFSQETKFEKRIKKDIDKLSKVSGFIDNELKLYDEETILDKKNTIIIIGAKYIIYFIIFVISGIPS